MQVCMCKSVLECACKSVRVQVHVSLCVSAHTGLSARESVNECVWAGAPTRAMSGVEGGACGFWWLESGTGQSPRDNRK